MKQPDAKRLLRLVNRCLAKQPSSRPSASQVEAELRKLSLSAARGVSRRREVRTPRTRQRAVPGEARRAWTKARFLLDAHSDNWCHDSFAALQKALDLAPAFVPARIDLSRWYIWAAVRGEIPYETGLLQGVREAEHAVRLDPDSTEALGALARAYYIGQRFEEAEDIFRRVIPRSPDTGTLCSYSELLSLAGRHEEALEMVTRALDQDASNTNVHCRKAIVLFCARRFDECVTYCKEALQLSPRTGDFHYFAGMALLVRGEVQEAVSHLARAMDLQPNTPPVKAAMIVALHRLGRNAERDQLVREIEESDVDPGIRAEAYAGLGRLDDALTCLEQAFRRDSPQMIGIAVNAMLDPLRGHPRFERLIRAVGLPSRQPV